MSKITLSRPLVHQCPFVDEVDNGTVTIVYTPITEPLELHALAAYLDGFDDQAITHEALTQKIYDDLEPEAATLIVTTTWTTAGFNVEVTVA